MPNLLAGLRIGWGYGWNYVAVQMALFYQTGDTKYAKEFLRQNPELCHEIDAAVRQRAIGGEIPLGVGLMTEDDSSSED